MAKRGTRGKGRKVVKRQSIAEFRAWLEGVEELQSDEWFPDVNQWTLIREKIDKIIDPIAEQPVNPTSQFAPTSPGMLAPGVPIPPPVQGGVPVGEVVSRPAPQVIQPNDSAAQVFQPGTKEDPKKTPEVGSGGPFNSPFE